MKKPIKPLQFVDPKIANMLKSNNSSISNNIKSNNNNHELKSSISSIESIDEIDDDYNNVMKPMSIGDTNNNNNNDILVYNDINISKYIKIIKSLLKQRSIILMLLS